MLTTGIHTVQCVHIQFVWQIIIINGLAGVISTVTTVQHIRKWQNF